MDHPAPRTWTSDNGNGTFTNPLFYDEFSDPDIIRVGNDFYLTGTTMHSMPGLPVLHSRDLVNWRLLTYAFERLDLGPDFRLEDGQEIYGQGIWAPCLRYRGGIFHIFSNINRHATQHFYAADPAGPWARAEMRGAFHDLSVLFDDDGKAYILWGYQGINFAQLNDELTDILPETQRVIIPSGAGMGEGAHFYKINGTYFITSAWFAGRMRMPCARADRPEGPYQVNPAISADEDFGLAEGWRLAGRQFPPFERIAPDPARSGRMSLHQGGIVDTPTGEWWGFSMMDYNSVGRLTCLSPVTWQDGWPYFGLPGNLGRTPRTWVKPATGVSQPPAAVFARDDDFGGPRLNPLWQWNHLPDDARWSLHERPGWLRLQALPAADFWWARNTLTQRAVGPVSSATVELDASGLAEGGHAGLALLNCPYAWLGVRRRQDELVLEQYEQSSAITARLPLAGERIWLRARCDFLRERGEFSYSEDGAHFLPLGAAFDLIFQLKTFQGVRFALFHYISGAQPGGWADFRRFRVDEPHPRGLMRPIPYGQRISLASAASGGSRLGLRDSRPVLLPPGDPGAARFEVLDRGLGRAALRTAGGCLSVAAPGAPGQVGLRAGPPGESETFQWIETPYGDLVLLSLASQRFLCAAPGGGPLSADQPGPRADRQDGVSFAWE